MSLPDSPMAVGISDENTEIPIPQDTKSLETHMLYSVEYISLPEHVASSYMNRKNELAYMDACGREFRLPLYPTMTNMSRNKEYKRLSRIVTAVRIRRLVSAVQLLRF